MPGIAWADIDPIVSWDQLETNLIGVKNFQGRYPGHAETTRIYHGFYASFQRVAFLLLMKGGVEWTLTYFSDDPAEAYRTAYSVPLPTSDLQEAKLIVKSMVFMESMQ